MYAEKLVVRTTATLLVGGTMLGLLAFATQISALGIALAIFIMASPVFLVGLGVWLKVRSRSTKAADAGTRESAREVGRLVLFLAFMFVVSFVVLGSGISVSVIVVGGFILGFGCGAAALWGIFGPFLPRILIRLRSVAGRQKALNEGVGQYLDGDVEQAAIKFRDYGEQAPDDEAGFHWQSIALVQKGQLEAALELADKGISLKPTAFGFLQRGDLLLALGCDELALADAEEGIRLNANVLALTFVKGAAFVNLRRLDDALDVLSKEKFLKRTVWSRYALGDAHRLRSEPKKAKAAYRQATRLAPGFARLDPDRSEGLWARALAQIGWFKHAERHIDKTLKRLPNDPHALYARAICEMAHDHRDSVAATLRHLLVVNPVVVAAGLTDPQFSQVLEEKRFRELLAWALGAQRQTRERVLGRRSGA